MAMTITPQVLMRVQANVVPGIAGTSGDYTAGVVVSGDNATADVVWSSRITLAAAGRLELALSYAGYAKSGTVTVTDALLTGRDPDGQIISLATVTHLGITMPNQTAYAGVAGYAVYVGRYAGAIAHWAPVGGETVEAFQQLIGPKNGLTMNATGIVTGVGGGIQQDNWCLYNPTAETMTVDVFVMGKSD